MGTLAGGVAHELGTPLGIIAGRAEQLLSRAPDDRSTRGLQAILEQTHRIERVVRGFLHVARGGDPTLTRVPPGEVIAGAIRLVMHRMERASVTLERRFVSNLPDILCDVHLLEHALVNLLLNAVDASPGGAIVQLEAGIDQGCLALSVIDSGLGISRQNIDLALQPFFSTKPNGTGLGLAITHEIVKLHRGSLSLEPRHPMGTIATIRLPFADSAGADTPASTDPEPESEGHAP
jgi:signal transduction histidine kinase